MAPRILILHASVGAGHARAAEALELTAKQLLPDATVVCKDVLDFSNRLFRRLYGNSYIDMVNKTPHLLGFMYDWLDRPSRQGKAQRGGDRLRLALQKMNLRPFLRLLHSQPWDLVLNTHFLPAEIIASLRKKGTFHAPQVSVVTDFDTHRLWVNQPCDHYYTATEEGRQYLCSWGIPSESATVTGIPIHPVFSEEKSRADLLAKYGLQNGPPIILQMAGGYGVGPIEQIYRSLLGVEQPVQIVAVAGRNEKVKTKLEAIEAPSRHRVRVLGFTQDIDELMRLADVVVTKPGGLTTSEVLASGALMVIVNPTPGQETHNSDFLLENNAAIKVNNLPVLTWKLTNLLADPTRLAQLKANSRRLGRPDAARTILLHALSLIQVPAS